MLGSNLKDLNRFKSSRVGNWVDIDHEIDQWCLIRKIHVRLARVALG